MQPLALGPERTGIIDLAAQLANVLDHQIHAVGIALAELAAAGVVGPLGAETGDAAADVVAALALGAEPEVFQREHAGEGKGIVGAGDIDVLRPEAGVAPEDLARVAAGPRGDGAELIGHIGPRRTAPADHPEDTGGRMPVVVGAIGAGDDEGGGVVGFHAAIEQMHRLHDEAAVEDVVDEEAPAVDRLGIVGGVLGLEDFDRGDLLRGGAEVMHMAHEGRAKALSGAEPAVGGGVQGVAADSAARAAGAAHAHAGEAMHGAEDDHRSAEAGLDHPDGDADEGLGAGAAAKDIHEEIEADAEIAGDLREKVESPRE